jgi:hypothetical protein
MKIKYFLPLLACILASCEMIVKVDMPEHKPSIVINALIDPSEEFKVHLSRSLGALDNGELTNINNAEVNVFENETFIGKLNFVTDGNYSSPTINPKLGKVYKLVVKASPYDEASAVARIPQPVSIDNVVLKDSAFNDPNMGVMSSLSLTINDPAGINNYYMVEVFATDSAFSYLSPAYMYSDDPALDEGYGTALTFSDQHFNGRRYKFDVSFYPPYTDMPYDDFGNPLPVSNTHKGFYILKFSTISHEYFKYQTSMVRMWNAQGNPFAEPAPVFTNVKQGLGIFAGKITVDYQFKR